MNTIEALNTQPHLEHEILCDAVLADLARDYLLTAIARYEADQNHSEMLEAFMHEVIQNIREDTGADCEPLDDPHPQMRNGLHEY